jgi:WD40 repeat protein
MFLVAYASGQLYVYNEEVACQPTPPQYQLFKQGDSFSVYTCKTKCTRNPIYRWVVGEGAISEFAFSPCGQFLAVASADGFLRIFDYNAMELLDKMRSYFGGLTCVCWSPDGRYVVTGGEDDLVTVWSVQERRVVCRGQGHKSWVNVVAFDSYTTSCSSNGDIGAINNSVDFSGSDDDISRMSPLSPNSVSLVPHDDEPLSYRFGSIGQDTMLCLWDITEDILRQPLMKHWTNNSLQQGGTVSKNNSCSSVSTDARMADSNSTATQSTGVSHRFGVLSINSDKKDKDLVGGDKKEHKRSASLASKNSDKPLSIKNNGAKAAEETAQYLGSPSCPHFDELPMLEPLVCKKIAHERLTDLHFREDCIVVSCQEGYVYTWARPGTALVSRPLLAFNFYLF